MQPENRKRKRNLDVARPGVYLKHRSRSEQCSMTIHHRVTPDGGPSSFYGQVAQNGTFLHNNKKEEEREREKKKVFWGDCCTATAADAAASKM